VGKLSETAGILTAALIVDGAVAADPVISPDGRWVRCRAWPGDLSAREPLAGRASAPDRRPGAHSRLVHPLAAGQL